ncbi:DUF4276 family protein [soil metagenome]
MVTVTILCEGATERNFVVTTLAPHLRKRNIFAKPIDLGGTPTVGSLHGQVNNALHSRRNHEYVSTMLDLYRLGNFPGNEPQAGEHVRGRVQRIEQSLFEKFPNPNFLPYIQLHEFEALVLVDVDKIPVAFPDGEADHAIKGLKASIGNTEPELINEHANTAPSKRIIAAIPAYKAVKWSAGVEIVEEIGLGRVRAACPHFAAWVTRLEGLGGAV